MCYSFTELSGSEYHMSVSANRLLLAIFPITVTVIVLPSCTKCRRLTRLKQLAFFHSNSVFTSFPHDPLTGAFITEGHITASRKKRKKKKRLERRRATQHLMRPIKATFQLLREPTAQWHNISQAFCVCLEDSMATVTDHFALLELVWRLRAF